MPKGYSATGILCLLASLPLLLFSCGKPGSELEIKWSPEAKQIIDDTNSISFIPDSLRKLIRNASTDSAAIISLYNFAEQGPLKNMELLIAEGKKQSTNFKLGQLYGEYEDGVYQYRNNNEDSALVLLAKSHDDAKAANERWVVAKSLAKTGEIYYLRDESDKSREAFEQALIIAQYLGDASLQAFCYNHLGELLRFDEEPDKAMVQYNKAISVAKKVNDLTDYAYALGALGDVSRGQGNYPKALDYYQVSMAVSKQIGRKGDVAYELSSIGDVNRLLQNYDKAISAYNEAQLMFEELKDDENIGYCLSNIADIYRIRKDFGNALPNAKKAFALAVKSGDHLNISSSLSTLGAVYQMGKQDDSALLYLQMALDSSRKYYSLANAVYSERCIAELKLANGKTAEALALAQHSLAFGQMKNRPGEIKNSSELLYRIYKSMGDYKNALAMHELYLTSKDSVNSSDQVRKFAAVEYASREKELQTEQEAQQVKFNAEKDKKDADLKRQRVIGYAISVVLLLVIALAVIIYRGLRQNRKARILIEQQKKEVEEQKNIIEEKQHEILASIRYAKRIQQSLLPTEKYIDRSLKRKSE